MRKRVLAMLVLLCVLIPASLGARSLASVSLGFGASYLPDDDLEFSQGLSDPTTGVSTESSVHGSPCSKHRR